VYPVAGLLGNLWRVATFKSSLGAGITDFFRPYDVLPSGRFVPYLDVNFVY